MLVENQKITVSWHVNNKKYYISKGHSFTKFGDSFEVDVIELTKGSKAEILYNCDFCGEENKRIYSDWIMYGEGKDCCLKCVQVKKTENIKNKDKVEMYKMVLSGERNNFPNKFFESLTEDEIRQVMKYFIELLLKDKKINSIEEVRSKLRRKHFTEYKLHTLTDRYGVSELVKIYFVNDNMMPWETRIAPKHYWQNEENVKVALNWFLEKLYSNNHIKNKKDIINLDLRKLTTDYGIYSLLLKKFNSSPFKMIDYYYPNEFNEWESKTVPKNYYKNKENVTKVLDWLVNKLLEDKYINSIDEIPKKVNVNTFTEYGLNSFLQNCFSHSTTTAFEFIFPSKWKPWEFNNCPTGFWNNGKNVRDALEWFVDKLIKDKTLDRLSNLPKLPIIKLLGEYGLGSLDVKFESMGFLFSFMYPEHFNTEDFSRLYFTEDGLKFDSKDEFFIHQYLSNNFENIKYFENNVSSENKFFNPLENESYVPDWIMGDSTIIEYFGWSSESYYGKNSRTTKYMDKTERKIKFFSSLKGYKFIAIYPKDLKNDLEGLKEKFKTEI